MATALGSEEVEGPASPPQSGFGPYPKPPTLNPCNDLPAPWTRRAVHFTGGLAGIGFAHGTNMLLVVSHVGRGVVDFASSELVARDSQEIPDSEFQENPFVVTGIGPIAGVPVHCFGLWGSGVLSAATQDGWSLQSGALYSPSGAAHQLPPPDAALRAVGFSPDGQVLLYATAASLILYYRGS